MGIATKKKSKKKKRTGDKHLNLEVLNNPRRCKSRNSKAKTEKRTSKRKQKLVPKSELSNGEESESDVTIDMGSEFSVVGNGGGDECRTAEDPVGCTKIVLEVNPSTIIQHTPTVDENPQVKAAIEEVAEEKKTSCVCAVRGCYNSTRENCTLQFFRLPTQEQEFNKCLMLIGRGDLFGQQDLGHYVCQVHFAPKAFITKKSKKLLKTGMMPSLFLPTIPDEGVSGLKEEVITVNKATQCHIMQRRKIDKKNRMRDTEYVATCKRKKLAKRLKHKAAFEALCDKFLNRKVSEVVKAQIDYKHQFNDERSSKEYEVFCTYLYHTSPPIYLSLQKYFKLPSIHQLKTIYTAYIKEGISQYVKRLKPKIDSMTDLEKNCLVLVNEVELQPHLFYNISKDSLVGFCIVDTQQTPQLARYGLVVIVRGLIEQWTLPVDYALFRSKDSLGQNLTISNWIVGIIAELIQAGLKVRLCLSNLKSSVITAAQYSGVTIETPFFLVDDYQIYYAYDPTFMMKSIYICLRDSEFFFQGLVAKWQDIEQFYEHDCKKQHRLVPELTEKHIMSECADIEGCIVTETLNERVAAGIANYIDFGLMNESAKGTVRLLALMGRLYRFMTSKTSNTSTYPEPFGGSEYNVNLMIEVLTLLKDLVIIQDGANVTLNVKFIKQLQISITAIMLLLEDLTLENIPNICMNYVQLKVFNEFLDEIVKGKKTKVITACKVIAAHREMLLKNILDAPKQKCSPQTISDIFQHFIHNEPLDTNISHQRHRHSLMVKISDYKDFKLPAKDQIIPVCEFLLTKCSEKHDCSVPKKKGEVAYTRYKGFFGDVFYPKKPDLLSVPDDNFIAFVEHLDFQLEKAFNSYFVNKRLLLGLQLHLLPPGLLSTLDLPCQCFPIDYLVKLFYRMRISQQLKANNKRFTRRPTRELLFCYEKLK